MSQLVGIFHDIINNFVYFAYYFYIIIFTLLHRRDIYKAACGGNGIPQPNELVKLFSAYGLTIYINESIHSHVEFDLNLGIFLLGCIGIANLGKFKLDSYKQFFTKTPTETKKEEEKH